MEAYLEIIVGPMYSGKTTELIEKYEELKQNGHNVCVINYIDDKRYSETKLSTHDGKMIECIQIKELKHIETTESHILVNEAQFFEDLYETAITWLNKNKRVYLYGLDGDFQRKKFGKILDLIPLCDNVKKKKAKCMNTDCKNEAIFSHRISTDKSQVVIGNDIYKPLCRCCYEKKNSI